MQSFKNESERGIFKKRFGIKPHVGQMMIQIAWQAQHHLSSHKEEI